ETVKELGIDVDVDEDRLGDMEMRRALLAYRACRWGIERWAGRTFARDDEIAAWWEQAQGDTQREWLAQNLQRTAAEADAGSAKAQSILRQVVPDLPHPEADKHFDPPWRHREGIPYHESTPEGFRVPWLEKHRPSLTYNEKRSCFELTE